MARILGRGATACLARLVTVVAVVLALFSLFQPESPTKDNMRYMSKDGDTLSPDEVVLKLKQNLILNQSNSKGARNMKCQHSTGGLDLAADSNGNVCSKTALLSNGCCETSIVPAGCSMCSQKECCSVYEHCVACCTREISSERLAMLLVDRLNAKSIQGNGNHLAEFSTNFKSCQFLCRTSSMSVQHQNKYRNKNFRFCYGDALPTLIRTGIK